MFKKLSLLVVSALILLLGASPVYANGGISLSLPLIAAYGAPLMVYVMTLGWGFLVVLLIEAFVIKRVSKIGWKQSVEIAFSMNLASTFGGFAILFFLSIPCSAFIALPLIPVIFTLNLKSRNAPPYFVRAALYTYFAGLMIMFAIAHYIGTEPYYKSDYFLFALPIFTGFGISLFIEALVALSRKLTAIWKPLLLANIFSYIFLAIAFPVMSLYLNNKY